MNNPIIKQPRFFVILFVLFSLQSCVQMPIKPPEPSYNKQQVLDILFNLKKQDEGVSTYYGVGHIKVQSPVSEFESNVVVIGSKDPFKIKLEMTHLWGRPLFHILIDRNQIRIISFPEKRYYVADIGQSMPTKLLPIHLDPDQIWSAGRGFTTLCPYDHAISDKEAQISLLDKQERAIQIINFYPGQDLPFLVSFPESEILLSFSDYKAENDIQYAKKIKIHDQTTGTEMELNFNRTVFNKVIDNSVFELVAPSGFEYYQWQPDS